jgi:hypothetical protein
MRGPELHTLLVTRPAPLSAAVGRSPVGGAVENRVAVGDPPPPGRHAAPAVEPLEGIAPHRQFASGGYQVHNGRPAAPVILG